MELVVRRPADLAPFQEVKSEGGSTGDNNNLKLGPAAPPSVVIPPFWEMHKTLRDAPSDEVLSVVDQASSDYLITDGTGSLPMLLAIERSDDDLGVRIVDKQREAVGKRMYPLDLVRKALGCGMHRTATALVEAGTWLVGPPGEEYGCWSMVMSSGCPEFIKAVVESVKRGRAVPDRNFANSVLQSIGIQAVRDNKIDVLNVLLDADLGIENGKVLMVEAIMCGNSEVVTLLRERTGIDEKTLIWSAFSSRAFAAYVGASDNVIEALGGVEPNQEPLLRKMLAHAWRLKGRTNIGRKWMKLESAFIGMFVAPLREVLFDFLRRYPLDDEDKQIVVRTGKAVGRLEANVSDAEWLAYFKAGGDAFLSACSIDHQIVLVFWRDWMLVCEKSTNNKQPILPYRIQRGFVDESVLADIKSYRLKSTKEIRNFLWRELPRRLGGGVDKKMKAFFDRWWRGLTHQYVGNCTLESTWTAMQAHMVLEKAWDRPSRSNIQGAYHLYKALQQNAMVEMIRMYLDSHKNKSWQDPFASRLLTNIFNKAYRYPSNWWANDQYSKLGVLHWRLLMLLSRRDSERIRAFNSSL